MCKTNMTKKYFLIMTLQLKSCYLNIRLVQNGHLLVMINCKILLQLMTLGRT